MKFVSYISCVIAAFTVISLRADAIKIYNQTDEKLLVALYYYPSSFTVTARYAQRIGEPFELQVGQIKEISRPERKLGYDREVVFFSPYARAAVQQDKKLETVLKRELTREDYKILPKFNIGSLEGSEFYIDLDETGAYKAYTRTQWKLRPVKKKIGEITESMSESVKSSLRKQYERSELGVARVRTSTGLGKGEQNYLEARLPKVKKALESLTGLKLADHETLRVAFIGSGGGYRAMITTLGSVIGAHTSGLLDAVTYFSALSGSTWMLAPWTTMGLSPREFREQLIPRVRENLFPKWSDVKISEVADHIYKKFLFNEPITLIDLFGALLGRKLLSRPGVNPYQITLEGQLPHIVQGNWVYPIYTSVVTKAVPYQWVEYTPHEVGSDYLGGYIPSWAFGRHFAKGTSTTFSPPQPLGFYLGIWGSAFSANFREIYQNKLDSIPSWLKGAIKSATEELKYGNTRVLPAKIFNYTLGMPGLPRNQEKTLTLVDAGLSCNLPAVPLFRKARKVDVMIFLDASTSVAEASELKCVEKYAQEHNLKFPRIDYTNIGKKIVSIFKDEKDPTVPVVIYMPRIKNPIYSNFDPSENIARGGYARMDNFEYTPEQVRELSGLTEFNMKESKPLIINALKDLILARRKAEAAFVQQKKAASMK